MSYTDLAINAIRWSRLGTTIDIGYRYSESDGAEDDWVLSECSMNVDNEEINKFMDDITDHFRARMHNAVNKDLAR